MFSDVNQERSGPRLVVKKDQTHGLMEMAAEVSGLQVPEEGGEDSRNKKNEDISTLKRKDVIL